MASLAGRQRLLTAAAVPALVALVLGVVITGQYQTSFELIIEAPLYSEHPLHVTTPEQEFLCLLHGANALYGAFRDEPTSEIRAECLPTVGDQPTASADVPMAGSGRSVTVVIAPRPQQQDLLCHVSPPEFESSESALMNAVDHNRMAAAVCRALREAGPPAAGPLRSIAQRQLLSIWGSVRELYSLDEHLLGTVLLLFSGVWPIVKQLLLLLLWLLPCNAALALRCLVAIDLIGKWSMVDVLFVGLLVTTLKLDIKVSSIAVNLRVEPHRGVYIYATSVLLSMALTVWMRRLARAAVEASALNPVPLGIFPRRLPRNPEAPDVPPDSAADVPEDSSDCDADSIDALVLPTTPASAAPPSGWPLFLAHLAVAVLITLGLLLPVCRVHRQVSILRFRTDTDYSVFGMSLLMYQEHGDAVLLALQVVFVCVIPLVKCWSTVFLWLVSCNKTVVGRPSGDNDAAAPARLAPRACWAVAQALQPWFMCDVFMLTLMVLFLRISNWVDDFGHGLAKITATPYNMPGFWCCLSGAVLDYALVFLQRRH